MKKIKTKSPSMLQSHLKSCNLDTIAESAGLMKRTPKKISPFMLLATFVLLGSYSSPAYSTCASIMAVFFRLRISKQAIWKRVQRPLVEFLRLVLQQKLLNTVTAALPSDSGCFASFKRVLVQDSTTIKLPYRLAKIYPSTSNKSHSKPAATLKIQTIIDLKNNVFTYFQLTPFRVPDQIGGNKILSDIRPGDLVVRDLGYYQFTVFKKILAKGASLLTRYKFKTALALPEIIGHVQVAAGNDQNISFEVTEAISDDRMPSYLADDKPGTDHDGFMIKSITLKSLAPLLLMNG